DLVITGYDYEYSPLHILPMDRFPPQTLDPSLHLHSPLWGAYSLLKIINEVQQAVKTSRKEVFQPHLPVRLPCYDLAPVIGFTLGRSLRLRTSGTPNFHGLTGGVYKARERIHRVIADTRLLANPTSKGRVADLYPNCEWL